MQKHLNVRHEIFIRSGRGMHEFQTVVFYSSPLIIFTDVHDRPTSADVPPSVTKTDSKSNTERDQAGINNAEQSITETG